jgi:hypothetical protein
MKNGVIKKENYSCKKSLTESLNTMGQEEILRKLNAALTEDIQNEYQVVYIHSRIRKYLELKDKKSKYKFLNFYCNWALHSKINRTEPVADVLREFIKGTDENKFLTFDHLTKDLEAFLNEHGLSDKILKDRDNFLRFEKLLIDIYSDTPLEVFPEEKQIITIKKGDGDLDFSCEIIGTQPTANKSVIVGVKVMKF